MAITKTEMYFEMDEDNEENKKMDPKVLSRIGLYYMCSMFYVLYRIWTVREFSIWKLSNNIDFEFKDVEYRDQNLSQVMWVLLTEKFWCLFNTEIFLWETDKLILFRCDQIKLYLYILIQNFFISAQ